MYILENQLKIYKIKKENLQKKDEIKEIFSGEVRMKRKH